MSGDVCKRGVDRVSAFPPLVDPRHSTTALQVLLSRGLHRVETRGPVVHFRVGRETVP